MISLRTSCAEDGGKLGEFLVPLSLIVPAPKPAGPQIKILLDEKALKALAFNGRLGVAFKGPDGLLRRTVNVENAATGAVEAFHPKLPRAGDRLGISLDHICHVFLISARARIHRRDQLKIRRESIGHRLLCMAGTFVLIDISWIFFRAQSITEAVSILRSMFTVRNPWILFDGSLYTCGLGAAEFGLLVAAILILVFADCCKYKDICIRRVILQQNGWFRYLFVALSVTAILLFGKYGPGYDAAAFIYFQF